MYLAKAEIIQLIYLFVCGGGGKNSFYFTDFIFVLEVGGIMISLKKVVTEDLEVHQGPEVLEPLIVPGSPGVRTTGG